MGFTIWKRFVQLSLLLAAASLAVWAISKTRPSQAMPDFLDAGRRVALVNGFIYLNLSRPPTPAEQAVVRQMDDLQAQAARREIAPVAVRRTFSTGNGSGDRWLLFGWEHKSTSRQVGPVTAVTDRRTGVWISPWAGVLVGLLPRTLTWALQSLQRRTIHHCLTHNLCPACGYDLRATPSNRCPECGTQA